MKVLKRVVSATTTARPLHQPVYGRPCRSQLRPTAAVANPCRTAHEYRYTHSPAAGSSSPWSVRQTGSLGAPLSSAYTCAPTCRMIGACGCASAIATTCRIASTEPAHELASAARAHVQRTQCTAVQRGPVNAVRTRLEGDVPAAGRKELANDLLRFVERRHTRRHANALDRRSLRCERAAADAQPQRWLKQYARLLVAKGRNGSARIGTIGPYHPAHVDTHHTPAGLTCSCPSRPYRVTRKWPLGARYENSVART